MEEELMTAEEFAKAIGVSTSTVYTMIREGEVETKPKRVKRRFIKGIPASEVAKFKK